MSQPKPRRKRLWLKILAVLIAIPILLGLGIVANTAAHYHGWAVKKHSPEALADLLRPYTIIAKPPGDGPFPTALLFSGCSGPKDNMARWSEMLIAHGWAAITIDSHTPRNFEQYARWRLVCAGQLFAGGERAGDVLASLGDAVRQPFVDPTRLALIGMSHGGWSIMDLMAFNPPDRLPLNLARMPPALGADSLSGIIGLIHVYPYCGPGNRARDDGWQHPAPALFILAAEDTIAPAETCIELADRLATQLPVERVIFEGVGHAFDQREKAPLSALSFNPEVTAEALATAGDFLDRITQRQ